MNCEIIDCRKLFSAIRAKKDDYSKAAMILNLDIPFENKLKTAHSVLKNSSPDVIQWFKLKLYSYYGDDIC